MVSVAFKNRTRDEIIAAFRESIRRKHEWQERAEQEIKKIRQERLQLSIWKHERTWLDTRQPPRHYIRVGYYK